MSTVPVFAARSRVTLPEVLVNLPRQTEMPRWPASKLGVRGLQMEGEVSLVGTAEQTRVRAIYQRRFPLIGGGAGVPRKLLEALDKIRWYAFQPREIYLIDNTRGFAHRERYAVD